MLKKPHYIALGFVGLLTLIILSLPQHTASQLKLAIGGLFLPLFGLPSLPSNSLVKPAMRLSPFRTHPAKRSTAPVQSGLPPSSHAA